MKKIALSYNAQTIYFKKYLPEVKVIQNTKQVREFDLIIFTGGEDVNPRMYGESNLHCGPINENRDDFERNIFMEAYEKNKKMIGICRGSQLLNVIGGGKLFQDIHEQATGYHNQHHPLKWKTSNDPFYKFFGEGSVFSTHHQAIKSTGSMFNVIATHKDIPEVTRSSNGLIYLFQFHPEFDEGNEAFFKFISEEW